ncbi:hypothetical protein D9M72_382770 [compost metagenome]
MPAGRPDTAGTGAEAKNGLLQALPMATKTKVLRIRIVCAAGYLRFVLFWQSIGAGLAWLTGAAALATVRPVCRRRAREPR